MSLMKRIAKNIRKHRKGQSLKKIANKAGIPVSTLEKIYYPQQKDITITTANKIAKALYVKVDDLIK